MVFIKKLRELANWQQILALTKKDNQPSEVMKNNQYWKIGDDI